MAPRNRKPRKYDLDMKKKKNFFKRIFPGFKKKATELSVLCGNSVGFICYGPDNNDLHVWPENTQSLQHIVAKFNEQSDFQREKNGCDLNDFIDFEGLSVDELTKHLSNINSHLVGVKEKKIKIVTNRDIVSEDHSRVLEKPTLKDMVSEDLDSQVIGIKPKGTSEDHIRVSDKVTISTCDTQLGLFGGAFNELGYMFRAPQESVSNLNSNDATTSVSKDVVGVSSTEAHCSEPDLVALGFPDDYYLPATTTTNSMAFMYDPLSFGSNEDYGVLDSSMLDSEFLSMFMPNTTYQTSITDDWGLFGDNQCSRL